MEDHVLGQPVTKLKGVGPQRASILAKLGIFTVRDILEHYPRRYEDRSAIKKVAQLQHGEIETIIGRVIGVSERKPRRGLTITKIGIADETGVVYGLWFNQAYIKKQFQTNAHVILSGKVERRGKEIQILDPEIDWPDNGEAVNTSRIVPVYPSTEKLSQRMLRIIIKQVLDEIVYRIPELLPEEIRIKHGLMDKPFALTNIHFPLDEISLEQARRRLVYEEFFILQLGLLLLKQHTQEEAGVIHGEDGELSQRFRAILPFSLTDDQLRVIQEIHRDMQAQTVMNRLLQGDVGSGKTVVAASALVKTVENGYQGALMAPTEILADQHFCSLTELLAPLGIRVAILTGSRSKKEREATLEQLRIGDIDIVVGTHALIQGEVVFHRLGLVVTDEQHRFGVIQRALLQQKGYHPDVLVMTATPIPRTLALTAYGDLDYSAIRQMPPGRKPVETFVVTSTYRPRIYRFIHKLVGEGRQVYIVCPLVEESDKLQAEAATQMAERLAADELSGLSVGLLHGRMKSTDKEAVMERFAANEIQVLVATTVIEVGVNVPNASLMIVEGAERFGLAQLHQLRGRVGRGAHKSYCILVSDSKTEETTERLNALKETADGFLLAEKDLLLRGPGAFFGTRQHGMPDLKLANLISDQDILEIARKDAQALIATEKQLSPALIKVLIERFTGDNQLIFVG